MNNKIYPGYWFARDVTGAMLVVRENSISLLWELNSIFVEILQKQFFLFTTNIAALSRGCKPRIEPIVWCAACLVPRSHYCAPPMRFGSRNQSESPGHSSLIRHRNALIGKAFGRCPTGTTQLCSNFLWLHELILTLSVFVQISVL